MSFFSGWFRPKPPPLTDLWNAIVALARQPRWYRDFAVPDTIDGRFDMVALMTAIVMLDCERRGLVAETALLTERFAADMDESLRDIGISDVAIGKHMKRLIGALSGRLGAYRAAFADGAADDLLPRALARNVWRDEAHGEAHEAEALGVAVRAVRGGIAALSDRALLAGKLG